MPRLLVIDDDEAFRSILADLLEQEGHAVEAAADGDRGVALAAANPPDLVLCDIVMSGIDGYGVLGRLRQDPRTAAVPVVFLTGKSESADQRRGMNLGADDYVVKPITRESLLAAVGARLARSAAIREEAERRLARLREDLTRSLLPHELLTPLTVVMGLSSLLMEDGAIAPTDVKEVAQGIFTGGQRLEEMITKFLVYAELEAAVPARDNPLDAARAVEVLTASAREKARRAGREGDIEIRGDGFAPGMSVDHLRSLVDELVENALKFSPAGSKVTIDARGEGHAGVLEVTDGGAGMTAEQLAAVQRPVPFLRRHQEQPGLGLGLAIVHRIAHLHGGELTFETPPDPGTTVRVRLPAS